MIFMKIVYFVLDKALSSYYSAMEEQVSIIIPIIVALLTGGFIILFLENQHVGASVIERYHFIMQPFMHRLSNYFKFLSSAKVYFSIKKGTKKDEAEYVFAFKDLMDKLSHLAHPCIMSGQDYPVSKFSAIQLDGICDDINNVWYYWDDKRNYMQDYCTYNTGKADLHGKIAREYLSEVFPHKYDNMDFSISLLSDVSREFYAKVYEPIQNIPFEYEKWNKEELNFKRWTIFTISFCLFTLVIILLLRYFTPLCVMNILTLLNIALLASCLYKFSKLESLSRKLFR